MWKWICLSRSLEGLVEFGHIKCPLVQSKLSPFIRKSQLLLKYYEIKEGNEFGAARAKAIAKGEDEFEGDGKKYPVKSVDKDDKENAKDFVKNESVSMKLKDLIKWLD